MPLTADQLRHIEHRLHEERERLTAHLRAFSEEQSEKDADEPGGNLSKVPMHPADLGSDVQNEELEATLATRRSAELAEIDDALARLTNSPDTFGLDANTGEEIPFERLDVIPYARTAVEVPPRPSRS
jgi:DnaK suppressor protein